MATMRKSAARLSEAEWDAFIAALEALHGIGVPEPSYRRFVRVHVNAMSSIGMGWGVHSMPSHGMEGRNFLAWHRHYLLRFEQRLQVVNPQVSIPYWDWIAAREMPGPIGTRAFARRWGLSREWDPTVLPSRAAANAVNARTTFRPFQLDLEGIHGSVHLAVGGTMATENSPADPLFWLHHANVDRLWARWQRSRPGLPPPNPRELLQPRPLFGVPVRATVDAASLGYRYV